MKFCEILFRIRHVIASNATGFFFALFWITGVRHKPSPIVFNFCFHFQTAQTRRGAISRLPKGIEDDMGFILRSVFWLALASIVVPAEARLGYTDKGARGREVPVSEQVHDAAYAVWGFATQLAQTCDTNPALCAAGQNLMSTVTDTGASLLKEAQSHLSAPENPRLAAAI